jgi:shikimate kinase
MKIFLIGLLGSGKSYLGKQLSELLTLPFIDLDGAIERKQGAKVAEIFTAQGEEHFRKIEATVLREQSKQLAFVMATGGGTPCFHKNMTFMNETGITVFIDPPLSEIKKRLEGEQRKSRPLLSNVSDDQLQSTLTALLEKRLEFYNQAHVHVSAPTITAKDILGVLPSKK